MSAPDLPLQGQRRRTNLAWRALSAYELQVLSIRRLTSSFNDLFRVRAIEGTFVLRVGPPRVVHADGAPEAERVWIAAVGAIAPQVLLTRNGSASVVLSDADVADNHQCMLLTWTPGYPLTRPIPDDDVRELARLAATLHATPEPDSQRPHGVLDAGHALLFEVPNLLPDIFAQALGSAQRAIQRLAGTSSPRRLHGDLTPNNVVRSRQGLRAVDFQDLMWGQVVQDLAHTMYGLGHDERGGSLTRAFLQSYAEVAPQPRRDLTPELPLHLRRNPRSPTSRHNNPNQIRVLQRLLELAVERRAQRRGADRLYGKGGLRPRLFRKYPRRCGRWR